MGLFDNVSYDNFLQAMMMLNSKPGQLNQNLYSALEYRQNKRKQQQEEEKARQQQQLRQRAAGLLDPSYNVRGDAYMPARDPSSIESGRVSLLSDEARGRSLAGLGAEMGDPSLMSMGKSMMEQKPKENLPEIGTVNVGDRVIPYNKTLFQKIAANNPDSIYLPMPGQELSDQQPQGAQQAQSLSNYVTFPIAKSPDAPPPLPPAEAQEQKAMGEYLINKVYAPAQDDARAARAQNAKLQTQYKLLEGGLDTGKTLPFVSAASAWLTDLGYSKEEAKAVAADSQKFNAISKGLVLDAQLLQKGPQTESDAKRLEETVSQLSNTQESNRFIIAFAMAQNNKKQEYAKFLRDYRAKHKTVDGAEDAWDAGPGRKSLFEDPTLSRWKSTGGSMPRTNNVDSLVNKYRTR